MTLDDLILTVESSSADEWHKMHRKTLYLWDWGVQTFDDTRMPYLNPVTHDTLAVFKKDIEIALALGATVEEEYAIPWVKNFDNPEARTEAVDLRYRGQLIQERRFAVVDGGRYCLPLPDRSGEQFSVSRDVIPFARLIFALTSSGDAFKTLEGALNRAKVAIV